MMENLFLICAVFNNPKSFFYYFNALNNFKRSRQPDFCPNCRFRFSRTHLTTAVSSGILSARQRRRAQNIRIFSFKLYSEGGQSHGKHEGYHPKPAAAGAGHRRAFVHRRVFAGLSEKGLRPLSGAGHLPQGAEQRHQVQSDVFHRAQPVHRGGSVRAHRGAGQRVGMVAAVGHRFAVLRDL